MKQCLGILFLLCVTSLIASDTLQQQCSLKVGYDEGVPFHFKSEDGKVIGSDIEILEQALKQVGCKIEYMQLPWARTLKFIKSGVLDIAIGASFKKERAKWAYYSVPYKSINHWIYTKNSEKYAHIYSIRDLFESQFVLGVVLGWNYPPDIRHQLDEDQNKAYVRGYESFKQLPYVLQKERVDAIIAIPKQLKNEIARDKKLQMFVPRAQYKEQLHFLFSKKSVSSKIIVEFNNALYSMLYNGTINSILRVEHAVKNSTNRGYPSSFRTTQ